MEQLSFIAKNSIESFIKEGKIPEFEINSEKLFEEKRGVFVTLKKQGQLRGCIGCITTDQPLYKAVSQMAIAAAFEDPRFPPVTKDELPELEYEISVLSPLKKVNSPKEIQLGVHGVQVVAGHNTGLFLPQVATENNWDLETFLNHLMLKAGLPPDYWQNNPVDFYVFQAEIIKEK
jgi:AmmeMemoRadiSam system protein A